MLRALSTCTNHIQSSARRFYATAGEERIAGLLRTKLQPNEVKVTDISGGCGSMYQIYVLASCFKGVPVVKQHRMVNEALKEEIKSMHGLRIETGLPKEQ